MSEFLKPIRGEELIVYVGNTVISGNTATTTFSAIPTVLNRSTTFGGSVDLITDKLPDLSDLSAPSQVTAASDAVNHSVSGTGAVHALSQREWLEWRDSGVAKIVRYGTAGVNGYYYEGPMILSQYETSGDVKQVVAASITLTPKEALKYVANGIIKTNLVQSI